MTLRLRDSPANPTVAHGSLPRLRKADGDGTPGCLASAGSDREGRRGVVLDGGAVSDTALPIFHRGQFSMQRSPL